MKHTIKLTAIAIAMASAMSANAWWGDDSNTNSNFNGYTNNNMYNDGYGNAYGNGWGDGSADADMDGDVEITIKARGRGRGKGNTRANAYSNMYGNGYNNWDNRMNAYGDQRYATVPQYYNYPQYQMPAWPDPTSQRKYEDRMKMMKEQQKAQEASAKKLKESASISK